MKLIFILVLLAASAHAQAPANSVLIGAEGITVSACSTSNCTFMFGTTAKFNTVANPKYPLVVNCGSGFLTACNLLGGDPVPSVAKSIYAVEQAVAYTVTVNGKAVTVPALPPTNTTYLLTCNVLVPNGTLPATLPANACKLVKQ